MMARLALRLRCTEGQLYTMVIGVVVAVFLLSAALPAAFREVVRPPVAAAAGNDTTTTTLPAAGDAPTLVDLVSDPGSPFFNPTSPLVNDAPEPDDADDGSLPEPPPPAKPCDSQATLDQTKTLLHTLNAVGVVPEESLGLFLAHLTGCKPGDPVILTLGVLAEFGGNLPDPGIKIPVLPLPVVPIPAAIVEQAQPLRDVIDPVCGGVGAVPTAIFYGLGPFPLGVAPTTLQVVNQLLLVCGQLQTPTPSQ